MRCQLELRTCNSTGSEPPSIRIENRNCITHIAASCPGEIAQELSPILLARHQLQRVQGFDKGLRMSDVAASPAAKDTLSLLIGTLKVTSKMILAGATAQWAYVTLSSHKLL